MMSGLFRAPRFAGFLGDHWVIQPAIAAFDPAVQCTRPVPLPDSNYPAIASEIGQDSIIVGQRPRGDLMPRRAPQQHAGPGRFGIDQGGKIGIAQALHVELHVRKIPQIAIGGNEGGREGISHPSPPLVWGWGFSLGAHPSGACAASARRSRSAGGRGLRGGVMLPPRHFGGADCSPARTGADAGHRLRCRRSPGRRSPRSSPLCRLRRSRWRIS